MAQRQAVMANTMISDRFEIFHVHEDVVAHMPLHYHDFYEINCVLDGTGVFCLDGTEYETTPGTVMLIAPNNLHNIVCQTGERYERAYIYVTDAFLTSHSTPRTDLTAAFRHYDNPVSRVIQMDPEALRHTFQGLDEPVGDGYGDDLVRERRFVDLMVALNQAVSASDVDVTPRPSAIPRLIGEVMAYVGDHLAEDLSLDALAARFYVSKYHLSREFKKYMRVNLHEYILAKRLLRSKELLRVYGNSRMVYARCGFKTYTHFLRSFKEEFSITPKEFLARTKQVDAPQGE